MEMAMVRLEWLLNYSITNPTAIVKYVGLWNEDKMNGMKRSRIKNNVYDWSHMFILPHCRMSTVWFISQADDIHMSKSKKGID